MKFLVRLVMIVMIATLIPGCENKYQKVERIILETLEERYDEEFVVDSIGNSWGTADDTTIKAYVYPVNKKDKMFKVAIKKDYSHVMDMYLPILMSEKLTTYINMNYKTSFEKIAYAHVTSLEFIEEEDNNLTLEEYFHKYPNSSVVIKFYLKVNSEDELDKYQQAEEITELINKYLSTNYKISRLIVNYLKKDIYEDILIDDTVAIKNSVFYETNEYSYNSLYIKFDDSNENNFTTEEIYKLFRN